MNNLEKTVTAINETQSSIVEQAFCGYVSLRRMVYQNDYGISQADVIEALGDDAQKMLTMGDRIKSAIIEFDPSYQSRFDGLTESNNPDAV